MMQLFDCLMVDAAAALLINVDAAAAWLINIDAGADWLINDWCRSCLID